MMSEKEIGHDFNPSNGLKLVVSLVDYNKIDEDGNPYSISHSQGISEYELARMDGPDFAEQAIELSARQVLHYFRGEEYE